MKPTMRMTTLLVVSILLLSACNMQFGAAPGVAGAELTAAAQTVQAQLQITTAPTLTALPPLPAVSTNTPAPTNTSIPLTSASSCNVAQFVADITVPDGTTFDPNENFTKTWRLKNNGTCTWTPSYAVVFASGSSMSGPASQALTGNVNPGSTVDISINLTAPASNGDYTGNYRLRDAGGVLFSQFYVQIHVGGGGGGGSGELTAVTGVTYDVNTFDEGGYWQDCPIVTAHITANGEGDVEYNFTRSDGQGGPTDALVILHFNSAGTKNVQEKWYLGSVNAGGAAEWLGIYIGDPNNQDFGHINVPSCTNP